jgi:hypothetical protein
MDEHKPRHHAAVKSSSNRSFGFVFMVFFLIVALWPLWKGAGVRVWALGLSAGFGALAAVVPGVLGPLNKVWTAFGALLHRIISPITLGVMFFVVVTPMALIVRALGKDLLRLRIDKDAKTYWIDRDPAGPDAESLKNQF